MPVAHPASVAAAWAADISVPAETLRNGGAILAVIVIAVVVRFLALRAITRLVRRAASGVPLTPHLRGRAADMLRDVAPPSPRRELRAETIGSVLRSVASIFILSLAFIEILGIAGLDLAPIVASAGIAGIALGFGAQNVVKDLLNGVFMILEDQYGVGDVIDVGPASGTVEAVGLRTTRLRDVEGTVWHIRNGEILAVGNKSQGWSRALLDVPVAYAEDVARVRTVIKAAADSVWRDPDFDGVVLEEPEVWGVEEFGVDRLTIRLVVKTSPLEQWRVARELRARVKTAFDEAEIPLPGFAGVHHPPPAG